jgi:hypothetical protein
MHGATGRSDGSVPTGGGPQHDARGDAQNVAQADTSKHHSIDTRSHAPECSAGGPRCLQPLKPFK